MNYYYCTRVHNQSTYNECVYRQNAEDQNSKGSKSSTSTGRRARFFALFKLVSSLPRAFSASLEGSVIEMKPTASALEDTVVSKSLATVNDAVTSKHSIFVENASFICLVLSS